MNNNVGQASSLSTAVRKTGWKPALLSYLFLAILGCSEKQFHSESLTEPIYSKQYRQHSITAIVTLSETNIQTSGRIRLMIDVHAPVDIEVTLPEIGNSIEPFSVADGYTEPTQTLPNGKRLHRRVWTLTPGLSGEHTFQSLEIQTGPESLKTDPINIHVESLLPAGTDSLEIKDIADPITLLPEEQHRIKVVKVLLGTFGALVILVLAIRLSRRRPTPEILLSPHEAAGLALENLPEDELDKIQALHILLLKFITGNLNVPTVGKTLNEIIFKLPKSALLEKRYPLEYYLKASEQARFSHKAPDGFAAELEHYIREFIQENEEALCD